MGSLLTSVVVSKGPGFQFKSWRFFFSNRFNELAEFFPSAVRPYFYSGVRIMKTESQSGADHQNPQLPAGSPVPPGIPLGDEVPTQQRLALPSYLSGISYNGIELSADRFLREPQSFDNEIMPAPKTALEPTIVEPTQNPADEYQGNMPNITPSDSPQSHREVEIVARALAVIGSPNQLRRWMNTSLPALQGQTPYSLMNSEGGRKQVEVVLGRIEHGIY